MEADPETTDVVVMTAKLVLGRKMTVEQQDFDHYDQELMTAVVSRAEKDRQAGETAHPAHQQSPVCRGQYGSAAGGAGVDLGGLEQVHGRRATGANRLLLDECGRRPDGAADGAAVEPAPRRVSRSGRGQSHPQDQRTPGQIGRGVALGGSGRRSCPAGPSRYGRGQRSVQGGHHHARSARRHERGSAADRRGGRRGRILGAAGRQTAPNN